MKLTPIALLCTAACVILTTVPALAQDQTPADEGNGLSKCDESYLGLYEKAHKAGFDVGRNRVDDGKLLSSGEVVQEPHPCELADRLDAMLNPPEPPAVDSSVIVAEAPVATSVPTTSAGGCPSYMAGEADSPSDVNPTSGAAGCFQIIPSTQAAHGCAAPDAACAAAICATQGDDAWVAADPCAYLGTEP